jgi:hypothetical protein
LLSATGKLAMRLNISAAGAAVVVTNKTAVSAVNILADFIFEP